MSPRLPLSAAAARALPLIAVAAACIQKQDPEFGGGGDNNPSGEFRPFETLISLPEKFAVRLEA